MTVDVVILGLGYVGLPIAREATLAGLSVIGFDVNAPLVEALNAGRSHVDDLSDHDIAQMIDDGFKATDNDAGWRRRLRSSIARPMTEESGSRFWRGPVRYGVRRPQSPLRHARHPRVDDVSRHHRGVGCARSWKAPALSPERTSFSGTRRSASIPASGIRSLDNTPKVVAGDASTQRRRGRAFYGWIVDEGGPATALAKLRLVKLLENTFRHVNIALVNEMAKFCPRTRDRHLEGIRAAATQAVRLPCFYPRTRRRWALHSDRSELPEPQRAGKTWVPVPFVELAQEINATMPAYVARRAQNILNEAGLPINGAAVLLLGVTYKANIADERESPAIPLASPHEQSRREDQLPRSVRRAMETGCRCRSGR